MRRGGEVIVVHACLTAMLAGVFTIQASRAESGQGKPALRIRGVVQDPEGTPVANVKIRILPGDLGDLASNSEGKFDITWERPAWITGSVPCYLVARHEQRNLAAAIELHDETDAIIVRLTPGVILTGKTADPNGKGIPDAKVDLDLSTFLWSASLGQGVATTDPNGTFEVRALPDGHKFGIYVGADGYGGKRSEGIDTDAATNNRIDVGVLTLLPGNLSISGRVVDVDGLPVDGASLSVFGDGQPRRVWAHADDEGRFTLDGVCAGLVNIETTAKQDGKRLASFVVTEAGGKDLTIVVREGRRSSFIQRVSDRSCEQILATATKAIAGVAVDESGNPVVGAPVRVRCHKTLQEGKTSWTYSDFRELGATTDAQGRFAIEVTKDGEYNLLFSPDKSAAIIVYDVPVGKKDLVVTLPAGGTVIGRLLRVSNGRKIPIPQAEVKLEQTSRMSFSHLGFDRDQTTMTDAEGRFRFEHLSTLTRENHDKPEFIPRSWRISFGETSETILFDKGDLIEDFELVIRPDPAKATPLAGSRLPDFNGIKIDLPPEQIKDKRMLVCFFDWDQRPSRICVTQLAKQNDVLTAKGVVVAAVSVSIGDDTALQGWAKQNQIPFPVGIIQGDKDETLFTWSVKSLPWLVLTDGDHTVTADGFNPAELTQKLDEKSVKKP
ncbi:MAG: MSCRAMM family protein [Solirubrobacterales bacterium]